MLQWQNARQLQKELLAMKQQALVLRSKQLKRSLFREWVKRTDLSAVQTAKVLPFYMLMQI